MGPNTRAGNHWGNCTIIIIIWQKFIHTISSIHSGASARALNLLLAWKHCRKIMFASDSISWRRCWCRFEGASTILDWVACTEVKVVASEASLYVHVIWDSLARYGTNRLLAPTLIRLTARKQALNNYQCLTIATHLTINTFFGRWVLN